uniref:UDP-glycosyltransferase eriJ n=1 Tax=Hericium erinaceus TaxID=91752 RepID=ERIJ_HERER|nr:RecName: Full=UDP-glycosyltransferase eriJ; AltName: Full=Erinacine biosynthesis cluster protein J [Hericium erinaceus]ARE72247.1 UDP-glycosyltransferase [Hericium erinaceus]
MSTQNYHIVAVPPNEWGHMRPMIAFLARLVAVSLNSVDITVTLIIAESAVAKARTELSIQLAGEGIQSAESRFEVVPTAVHMFWPADAYLPALKATYAEVIKKKEPDFALLESMIHPFFDVVRSSATKPIKVGAWLPVALPSWTSMAPICYIRDDPQAYVKQVETTMAEKGLGYMEAASDAYLSHVNGRVLRIPGFPEMTDYEGFPQEPPVLLPVAMVVDWVFGIRDADILVTSTAQALERQGLQVFSKWLKEQPKHSDILAVGPLTSQRTPEVARKEKEEADAGGFTAFLDAWAAKKGPKSVLYICFGSVLLPAEIEHLYAVMRVLLELQIPFIMVLSDAARAALPADLAAAVRDSGLVKLTPWAPQQYILAHAAVGWFLSHCGINGTLESLCLRVPMVCWPLFADQPVLSILVAQVYGCGYELGEVRKGFGLKYRASTGKTPGGTVEDVTREAREVFSKAFFNKAERAKVDANLEKMATELNAAWDAEGDARASALALLDFIRK